MHETGFRILIVDDSTSVRERLVRMLGDLSGVRVVGEAGGAGEAIDRAAVLLPDLVTLDLELGDGSGFAVLEAVSTLPSPPLIAVVTNHAARQVQVRCLSAGADYVFDKSREFEGLSKTVARLAEDHATKGRLRAHRVVDPPPGS